VNQFLDFGHQPIRNRFLTSPTADEFTDPLTLGCCGSCGSVQLLCAAPLEEVRPRFDWITYSEPEGHLDALADDLRGLPGVTPESVVCGISYKDDSTLRRLRDRGLARTCVFDPCAGVETIQDRLRPDTAAAMVATHGPPDLVVVRHLLEHAHDVHRVLEALRRMVSPRGYIVFEVPDAGGALERCDYRIIWEEHVVYFTPATLRTCLARAGLDVVRFARCPYALEDSLVAIARPRPCVDDCAGPDSEKIKAEVARAERFGNEFHRQCERCRAVFADRKRQFGTLAFFGAGHLTAAVLNFFGLRDFVDFVVDDNPRKVGLFMPGSRLPILSPDALVDRGVRLCCLGVHPEAEERVIARHRAYLGAGGVFASLVPGSRHALTIRGGSSLPGEVHRPAARGRRRSSGAIPRGQPA
jgi:hypothetical protein